MGYYNIYKIIKDAMRTLFGSRVFRILLILDIVFILFIDLQPTSFGSYSAQLTSVTLNGSTYDLDLDYITSQYKYYFLCWRKYYSGGDRYINLDLFCSNEEMTFFKEGDSTGVNAKEGFNFICFHVSRFTDSNYLFNNAVSTWNDTFFDPTLNNHTYKDSYGINVTQTVSSGLLTRYWNITLANYNVKDQNNDIIFNNNVSISPFFTPSSTDIQSLNFDKLFVEPADFGTENPLFVHVLEIVNSVSNGDDTIYYYGDNIIMLDNTTSYYKQYLDSDYYYYSIPKYKLSLKPEKTYLLLLSSSNEYINNSIGLIDVNYSDNYFDVIQINTGNLITSQDVINDNIQNIEDTLSNDDVTSDIETNIDDSLKFDNQNAGLNNLNNGFFSHLTTMLSNLLGYNLSEDTSISIPLPNSNKTIVLHSKYIYDNITGSLRLIINAFWLYIFSFYMWKFINKIYIAVSTGNILDTFSSSGEAITNDML